MLMRYPPYPFLTKIFEKIPSSIFTYLALWNLQKHEEIHIRKDSIRSDFHTCPNDFEDQLHALRACKLLYFVENSEFYSISLERDHRKQRQLKPC